MKNRVNIIIGIIGIVLVSIGAILKVNQFTLEGKIAIAIGLFAETIALYRWLSNLNKK